MILQCYKSGKKVVLSGDVSDLGDLFMFTIRIMEADFAGGWVF